MLRIENKDGLGPYIFEKWLGEKHTGDNIHYGPHNDPKLKRVWNTMSYSEQNPYIFGFKNVKQYCAWFSRAERLILFKKGYRLKKVEVSSMVEGSVQCIGIRR